MFVILYIIFVKFLQVGRGVENWPIALFLGLVMWEFFNEVTKSGLKAIVGRGGIIRKINFPKYIIIVASSVSAFINMLLNMVVVALFAAFSGVELTWSLLLIPVFIAELYAFSLGCSFILSTLYVRVRDIDFIWEIITRAGFYAVGVLFPMAIIFEKSQLAGQVLLLNPVAQSINDARNALIGGAIAPTYSVIGEAALIILPISLTIFTLIFGALYFRQRSRYFAEDV